MKNSRQFFKNQLGIKEQVRQYLCELIASVILIIIFLLIRNMLISSFPDTESNFQSLLIGFLGSALSLLFSLISFLVYSLVLTTFSVQLILHSCQNNEIRKCLQEMTSATYSTQKHWGRVVKDLHSHPSNVAEGILAFSSVYEAQPGYINDQQLSEICTLANKCVQRILQIRSGHPEHFVYTTQALGMQLCAIKKCVDLNILELTEQEQAGISEVVDRFINCADPNRGWGYFAFNTSSQASDSGILVVPTLWGLRAINAWRKGSTEKFEKILTALSTNSYQVGFKYNSEPRFSSTALYHILISELRDSKLAQKYDVAWKVVSKSLINNNCPEIEVELSYYTTQDNRLKTNYWIHLSRCLVMEAAMCNQERLTIRQAFLLKKMIHQSVSQVNKYYHAEDLPSTEDETPVYPSFYLMWTLSRLFIATNPQ